MALRTLSLFGVHLVAQVNLGSRDQRMSVGRSGKTLVRSLSSLHCNIVTRNGNRSVACSSVRHVYAEVTRRESVKVLNLGKILGLHRKVRGEQLVQQLVNRKAELRRKLRDKVADLFPSPGTVAQPVLPSRESLCPPKAVDSKGGESVGSKVAVTAPVDASNRAEQTDSQLAGNQVIARGMGLLVRLIDRLNRRVEAIAKDLAKLNSNSTTAVGGTKVEVPPALPKVEVSLPRVKQVTPAVVRVVPVSAPTEMRAAKPGPTSVKREVALPVFRVPGIMDPSARAQAERELRAEHMQREREKDQEERQRNQMKSWVRPPSNFDSSSLKKDPPVNVTELSNTQKNVVSKNLQIEQAIRHLEFSIVSHADIDEPNPEAGNMF